VIWLGSKNGYLTDWVTQQWVRATGRGVLLAEHTWLDGPIGNTRVIGKGFFQGYAQEHDLEIVEGADCGLLNNFSALAGDSNTLDEVAPAVQDFYEHTSAYDLDAWSEWHGLFRPFGLALAVLFSRRLQQLNIPLSPLDSSKGMSSNVLQMWGRQTGQLLQTAWVRELHATKNVIYAGCYSVCRIPGHGDPCVKVLFPLPNGNAIVLMKPESHGRIPFIDFRWKGIRRSWILFHGSRSRREGMGTLRKGNAGKNHGLPRRTEYGAGGSRSVVLAKAVSSSALPDEPKTSSRLTQSEPLDKT
jgi:hypothetical protein